MEEKEPLRHRVITPRNIFAVMLTISLLGSLVIPFMLGGILPALFIGTIEMTIATIIFGFATGILR